MSWALARSWTPARWGQFVRRYRREMSCLDATQCHRTLLRDLLVDAGADVSTAS